MKKKRILVVDDDQSILDSLQVALADKGYEVLLAHDGNEGLIRAERDSPDLVVLDMMMPRRSGFMVLSRLRLRRTPTVRIIMMTANEDQRHEAFAKSQGVDAFLHKPFDLEQFLGVVQSLLPSGA